jgi:type I restriction-modification system DNA methylase subunit
VNGIDCNNLVDRKHFGDVYEQLLNDLQSACNAGEYDTPRGVTGFMGCSATISRPMRSWMSCATQPSPVNF